MVSDDTMQTRQRLIKVEFIDQPPGFGQFIDHLRIRRDLLQSLEADYRPKFVLFQQGFEFMERSPTTSPVQPG